MTKIKALNRPDTSDLDEETTKIIDYVCDAFERMEKDPKFYKEMMRRNGITYEELVKNHTKNP